MGTKFIAGSQNDAIVELYAPTKSTYTRSHVIEELIDQLITRALLVITSILLAHTK